jgi:hypothetical protein
VVIVRAEPVEKEPAGESNLRHAIATRLGQHRDRDGGSPR